MLQAADRTVKVHSAGKRVRYRAAEIKRELFWNEDPPPVGRAAMRAWPAPHGTSDPIGRLITVVMRQAGKS